jgi:ADP-ribose pyrophosphatase
MTAPKPGGWQRQRRTTLVDSEWIKHHLDTLQLPSGKQIDFHALEFPMKVVGVVPVGDDGRILLTLQYRYMVDASGWEIPAGNVPLGESVLDGARRELYEETGHTARTFTPLYDFYPQIGRSNHHFTTFVAQGVREVTDVVDGDEVSAIRWFTLDQILQMICDNSLRDGFTALAILAYQAFARSA